MVLCVSFNTGMSNLIASDLKYVEINLKFWENKAADMFGMTVFLTQTVYLYTVYIH